LLAETLLPTLISTDNDTKVLVTIKWEPYYLLRNNFKKFVEKNTSHFIRQIQQQAATCIANTGSAERKNTESVKK
jgi:hypothetical protein